MSPFYICMSISYLWEAPSPFLSGSSEKKLFSILQAPFLKKATHSYSISWKKPTWPQEKKRFWGQSLFRSKKPTGDGGCNFFKSPICRKTQLSLTSFSTNRKKDDFSLSKLLTKYLLDLIALACKTPKNGREKTYP